MIKQLTVFLPNRPGMLVRMGQTLGERGVQILGLMVADASDFSTVRAVVDKPRLAVEALDESGFQATLTDVVATEVPDVPGGLASVLERLASADLNVGYAYCCVSDGRVVDIVSVTGEPVAVKLAEIGFKGFEPADLGIEE